MASKTRIEPRATYIYDFAHRTPPLVERVCNVEEENAIAMLRVSPYVNREFDPTDPNWFLNKGFVPLEVNALLDVAILYRHDFNWSLWSATEANACVMFGVASLDELRVP